MIISEEERREILSKYSGDTSDELLTYLKRNFPVTELKHDWMNEPIKFIQIGDKTRTLHDNKKYLVSKIYDTILDLWIGLGEKKIRRTIKKYLDGYR